MPDASSAATAGAGAEVAAAASRTAPLRTAPAHAAASVSQLHDGDFSTASDEADFPAATAASSFYSPAAGQKPEANESSGNEQGPASTAKRPRRDDAASGGAEVEGGASSASEGGNMLSQLQSMEKRLFGQLHPTIAKVQAMSSQLVTLSAQLASLRSRMDAREPTQLTESAEEGTASSVESAPVAPKETTSAGKAVGSAASARVARIGVFIALSDGSTLGVTVDDSATVRQLKIAIIDAWRHRPVYSRMRPSNMRLFPLHIEPQGSDPESVLEDGELLSSYGIAAGSTLRLILPTTMQIFVALPDRSNMALDVCASDTIASVKEQVAERNGARPAAQRLMYIGHQLEDAGTLRAYNIQDQSKLHLLFRQCGD